MISSRFMWTMIPGKRGSRFEGRGFAEWLQRFSARRKKEPSCGQLGSFKRICGGPLTARQGYDVRMRHRWRGVTRHVGESVGWGCGRGPPRLQVAVTLARGKSAQVGFGKHRKNQEVDERRVSHEKRGTKDAKGWSGGIRGRDHRLMAVPGARTSGGGCYGTGRTAQCAEREDCTGAVRDQPGTTTDSENTTPRSNAA